MKAKEIVDREIATFTLASRDDANLPDLQAWQALKAVLEIHQELWLVVGRYHQNFPSCKKCGGASAPAYPCPTVIAIEKALGLGE